jgi:hypothetical protein
MYLPTQVDMYLFVVYVRDGKWKKCHVSEEV